MVLRENKYFMVEDFRIKMGLWGQGNSIEVRCWVSNIYYQMGNDEKAVCLEA
jgi:hypothetical protein